MSLQKLALTIRRGATVSLPIRVESAVLRYAAIATIDRSAPVRIVAPGHGIPDGWRAAVANARGITELNAKNNPPRDAELLPITVIDADTVEINHLNAAGFPRAHIATTGHLVFYAPVNLDGFVGARMDVKKRVGGVPLASFSATAGTLDLDGANNALWLLRDQLPPEALAAGAYVFDIELLRVDGTVEPLCAADSPLTVLPETTTTD